MPWDDLQLALPGAYSDHRAYSLSKLLMAMFSMELVRYITHARALFFPAVIHLFFPCPTTWKGARSHPITYLCVHFLPQAAKHGSAELPVVCCDPGTVNTKMLEAGWGLYGIDVSVANDETFLATDPGMGNCNGKYFVSRRDTQANGEAYDAEARQRLWAMLEEICGIKY